MFFKEVSSVHQACIYLIQHTAKTVKFWNIFTIQNSFLFEYVFKCNLFLWFQSWILSSLLQSHDPSEITVILICCSKKIFIIIIIIIIIMLKTAE